MRSDNDRLTDEFKVCKKRANDVDEEYHERTFSSCEGRCFRNSLFQNTDSVTDGKKKTERSKEKTFSNFQK